MNYPQRGNHVIEIATGRKATVVFSHPFGTDSHSEPWAKVMFSLTKEEGYGVSFACRDLSELCFPWDYEWLVVLAGITPDNSQFAPTVVYHDTADGAPHIAGTHPDMCTECWAMIHGSEPTSLVCGTCGYVTNPLVDGDMDVLNGIPRCSDCVSKLLTLCGGSEPGSEWECGVLDGKPCTCPILCEICGSGGAVINSNGDAFCVEHCVDCPASLDVERPCNCGRLPVPAVVDGTL